MMVVGYLSAVIARAEREAIAPAYKGLRFCVDVVAIAGWAGCIWWTFLFHSIPVRQIPVNQLIGVGLVAIGVAVFRVALRLLADIGDVLIEENRRK
jgi:hypothetical protein